MGELMSIKPIKDNQKEKLLETLKNNFKQSWYFEKWYEKLILVGLCVLGIWKIVGFF